ncbi:hypothetical protein HG536_0A02920 [Torulaspora globosa]|uniref:Nodulin-like domain-containing protein n=1 Tax=Torulaspora globosa TaxID=48254 RepID=A0A7G3ZAD9_9SACH|nr:uncharacterized protein HG536_0A02920 [Torulaspora globosa]QLL30475.1 hypothetical protein HG536_0A02920 [Torulaspora globosa]
MESKASKRAALAWCFVGSNIVALGAGTPYMFSFYGPQLLSRCQLPISRLSMLSLSLNVGSALLGFLAGVVIDRSVMASCFIGTIATFTAYSILDYCYIHELSSLALICLGLALVGFGSVSGFYAAVKCCTTNFPHHRGTAGAFPVALYALSGMLLSFFCTKMFGDDIDKVFKFLTFVCSGMIFVGCLTLRILVNPSHKKSKRKNSNHIVGTCGSLGSAAQITRPIDIQGAQKNAEIGSSAHHRQSVVSNSSSSSLASSFHSMVSGIRSPSFIWSKELTGSLSFWGWGKVRECDVPSSEAPAAKAPGPMYSSTSIHPQSKRRESFPMGKHDTFVRDDLSEPILSTIGNHGFQSKDDEAVEFLPKGKRFGFWANNHVAQTIKKPRFIAYLIVLATLQGIGQMYIYSVGFIVRTQIASTPSSEGRLNAEEIQSLQVSIISVLSFLGRLSSGPVSDILIKKLKAQRLWNVVMAAALMSWASSRMLGRSSDLPDYVVSSVPKNISNVSHCSAIFGFAFGILFGTFPPIIADSFGTDNFSSIWGLITSGGLITVKVFCSILGADLSRNTLPDQFYCDKGTLCYRYAFHTTAMSSLFAMVLALLIIAVTHNRRNKRRLVDGELSVSTDTASI